MTLVTLAEEINNFLVTRTRNYTEGVEALKIAAIMWQTRLQKTHTVFEDLKAQGLYPEEIARAATQFKELWT
jgi:hypothetical protein